MITKFKIFEELNTGNLKVGNIVVCISPIGNLTFGKKYIILSMWRTNDSSKQLLLNIYNDEGDICPYRVERFVTTMEYNAKKFNI